MREQRLVFGEDAGLYDEVRPSYPAALVDHVVALADPPGEVLDIGCGTGKATVLLADRCRRGVGVEADPAMAGVARRHLAGHPGWSVEISDFEAWEPGERLGTFALVCCAQAWHWLDPAARLKKAHDLLRPGGWLALWWNLPGADGSPARPAMDAAYRRFAPDLTSGGIGSQGGPPRDSPREDVSFGPGAQHTFPWSHDYTSAEWVALLRTQSNHRLADPDDLERLLAAVREAIDEHGGVYRHTYESRLWTAQKVRPGDGRS